MRIKFGRIIMNVFWILSILMVNLVPVSVNALETVSLPERELTEEILNLDGFYLASDNVFMEENSNTGYVLHLGRGGSCKGEASVTVRMADFTSRYGTDYEVALMNGPKADVDENQLTFMDLMTGEYEYGVLPDEEQLQEEYENDPELRETCDEAIKESLAFVGLEQVEQEEKPEEAVEITEEIESEVTEPVQKSEEENILSEYAQAAEEGETLFTSPLQQAYADQTGIVQDRQIVESNGTTEQMKAIQSIADTISSVTVGATLRLTFEDGEKEKYLVIVPKDNSEADANRSFYITLADPENAAVSEASSCAFTIIDDEEVLPCNVFFNGYDQSEDAITVYFKREGCLNQISSVTVYTTGNGSAKAGMNYSIVNTPVLFSFGIPEAKIVIPVNKDNLYQDADFELRMEAGDNASVEEGILNITMYAEPEVMDAGIALAASGTGTLRSLDRAVTDDEHAAILDMDGIVRKVYSNNYGGANYYDESTNSQIMWWERDSFFSSDWTGKVGVNVDLCGMDSLFAGAAPMVYKKDDCFIYIVGLATEGTVSHSSTYIPEDQEVYRSKDEIDHKQQFYYAKQEPEHDWLWLRVINYGQCSDCNKLQISDVVPIYRWHEWTVTTEDQDLPLFLNENGQLVADRKSAELKWVGANNEQENTILTHANDCITLMPANNLAGADSSFVTLKSIRTAGGMDVPFTMIDDGRYDIATGYELFSYMQKDLDVKYYRHEILNTNQVTWYGVSKLKAAFDYKDTKIQIAEAKDEFGKKIGDLVLSGTVKPASDTPYTYHLGDTIRITSDHKDTKSYHFVGVNVRTKTNETDMNWSSEVLIRADEKTGALYLNPNGDHRLREGYYEITPVYEYTDNAISVRIRAEDEELFDSASGILADRTPSSVRENDELYKEYLLKGVTRSSIYSLPVKTKDASYEAVWTESGSDTEYGGNVFYYTAKDKKENNVIYLTARQSSDRTEVNGRVLRYGYNALTKYTDSSLLPFEGALVMCGSSSVQTRTDGCYTIAVNAPRGTSIRYLICYNGNTVIQETKAIGESVTDSLILNPENGTLLSNLTIDADQSGRTGNVLTLNGTFSKLIVSDNGKTTYKKTIVKEDGSFGTEDAVEHITEVMAVIRDPDGTEVASCKAEYSEEENGFVLLIPHSDVNSLDKIYLSITSDRVSSDLIPNEEMSEEEMEGSLQTVYNEIYSGYSFAQSSLDNEIPAQSFGFMPNLEFVNLPLLSSVGYFMVFPVVKVNIEVRNQEYILTVGVSVMDIVDKVKGTHINKFDNGGIYKGQFEGDAEGLLNQWKEGFKNSVSLINDMRELSKKGWNTQSALGGFSWKFDVAVGAYAKFTLQKITTARGDSYTDFFLTGLGGYVGASVGLRKTFYFVMPVVYLPWYFGIQGDVSVTGFFGSSIDPNMIEHPITYEDASRTSVDMGSLCTTDVSVKGMLGVYIFAGVGICDVIGARAGGKVNLMGLYQPLHPDNIESDYGAQVSLAFAAYIDLFVYTIPIVLDFPKLHYGSIAEALNVKESAKKYGDTVTNNPFVLNTAAARGEAQWMKDPAPQAGFEGVTSSILEINAYNHPDSRMVKMRDGTIILAFIDRNENKVSDGTDLEQALSSTVLKLAVNRDGRWSEPVAVQKDSTSDFMPGICTAEDGSVLVSWISTKPESTDTIEKTDDYLEDTEVYCAVVNAEEIFAGNITAEVVQVTDDEFYDSDPVPVYDEATGKYAVFFTKADRNMSGTVTSFVNPYVNSSVVAYAVREGDRWFETGLDGDLYNHNFLAAQINEEIQTPAIADLDAIAYSTKNMAVLTYTVDMDSSNETNGDKELYMQLYDFKENTMSAPIALTEDHCSDTAPQLVKSTYAQGEKESVDVFWYRNDEVIAYLDLSELIEYGLIKDQAGRYAVNFDYRREASGSLDRTYTGDEKDTFYSYVMPGGDMPAGRYMMSGFTAGTSGMEGADIYVVWPQGMTDENGDGYTELYMTAFVGNGSETAVSSEEDASASALWSVPYRLTKYQQMVDEPAVLINDENNLFAVFNRFSQSIETDENNTWLEVSDIDLVALTMRPCGSTEAENIVISDSTPAPGDEVEVKMDIVNTGVTYATGYTAEIYEETSKGRKLLTTIVSDERLNPAQRRTHALTWKVPADPEGAYLHAEVCESGYRTVLTTDSAPLLSAADLSIEEAETVEIDGNLYLSAKIYNSGNAVSSAEDGFDFEQCGPFANDCGIADEERTFAKGTLEGIRPGESKEILAAITAPEGCYDRFGYVTCLLQLHHGEEEYNSYKSVEVHPAVRIDFTMNRKELPETIDMTEGDVLDALFEAEGIAYTDLIVVSSDGTVVSFEDGKLTALGEGTAEIRGTILPCGQEFGPISITVKSKNKPQPSPTPEEEQKDDPVPGINTGDPFSGGLFGSLLTAFAGCAAALWYALKRRETI